MLWPRGAKRPTRPATPNLLLYISAVTLLYLSIKSFLVSRRRTARGQPSALPPPEGAVGALHVPHIAVTTPPGPGCVGWGQAAGGGLPRTTLP